MGAFILAVLLTGPADGVSMQQFQTAEACEQAGKWLALEHYLKRKGGNDLSWKCIL